MRRFLGLSFVLGAFACAGSAERAADESAEGLRAAATTIGPHALRSRAGGSAHAVRPAAAAAACAYDVTLHGNPGTVVVQPSVAMLFWGSYWAGAGAAAQNDYATAWATIANDPAFYARLAEYSTSAQTIGTGSWAGFTLADPSLADGATISEAQIQAEIGAEIAAGSAPSLTASRIYVVMLPPGVTSVLDSEDDFAGHHAQFVPAGETQPVRYAVITYNTDEGYNDPVVSHEVSEATTDPDLTTGWYDQDGDEISDICRFTYSSLDGYLIEDIYSMKSCACVGATTTTDAGTTDAATTAVSTPTCTAPAWSATATYAGGNTVSYAGSQYTAAYWNQNDAPDTHSGAAGSGSLGSPPCPARRRRASRLAAERSAGAMAAAGRAGRANHRRPATRATSASRGASRAAS